MKGRFHKIIVRGRVAFGQNRLAIAFVAAWLAANTIAFTRLLHLKPLDAILVAFCLTKMPTGWPSAYQAFTEVVVFGVVASVVVGNVTRKYRPEETCRALARQASGHVVILGWTNLGKRIFELASVTGKQAVVVDADPELLLHLVRAEEPVIIGPPGDRAVLESASVPRARVVVIATDDLETAAVACRLVRELNAECELVVRCADEDVGAVLARTYRARALSTSRMTASVIQAQAVKLRAKNVIVFGKNNLGERTAEALAEKRIAVRHVASTSSPAELAAAGIGTADLVVLCDDDLGDNLIRVERIRDLDKRVRILCRAFHEDAAQVLTRAPFDCTVFSTSRHAAEALAKTGVFREMGIESAPAKVLDSVSA